MAFVVSSRRSQELATTAVTPVGREAVEGLPNPKPIVDFLPASLQEDDFCRRMVSGFDEVLAPVFASLDCFDAYLDPKLAPADFVDWLASWLGVEIDETWTADRRRHLIEQAVALYRVRGTAAGLAAHVRLYCGVTPEIEESGGCSWSQTSGSTIPGSPQPHLAVRLQVDDQSDIRRSTVGRIVDASRPAHVPYSLDLTVGGATVHGADGEAELDGAAAGAPGAVDLPGSEHIELAPPAPATAEEIEGPPDEGEPAS